MNSKYNYAKIKCAAIRNGEVIISGYRHDDCFRNAMAIRMMNDGIKLIWEQGFIDLNNEFYNREEAAKIAFEQGQTKTLKTILFSEDLY